MSDYWQLLGGSLLSFVSVVYIAYQAFLFTGRIKGYIDSINAQIRSANFFFMFASLTQMVSIFSDSPFPEDTYQRSQEAINFITNQLNLLAQALTIAFYIATTISCLIFVFAFLVLLYDFKKRVRYPIYRRSCCCAEASTTSSASARGSHSPPATSASRLPTLPSPSSSCYCTSSPPA